MTYFPTISLSTRHMLRRLTRPHVRDLVEPNDLTLAYDCERGTCGDVTACSSQLAASIARHRYLDLTCESSKKCMHSFVNGTIFRTLQPKRNTRKGPSSSIRETFQIRKNGWTNPRHYMLNLTITMIHSKSIIQIK